MTQSTTSRDLVRPITSELRPSACADATLAAARRLSEAYNQVFTIVSEGAIRMLVPTSDDVAQHEEPIDDQTTNTTDAFTEVMGESELAACCGGRQENLRRRLRRVRAISVPSASGETRKIQLCSKLELARVLCLQRSALDRRVVDGYVNDLIGALDERRENDEPAFSADRLLAYDAPIAELRCQIQRLKVARAHIHQARALMVDYNRRLVLRVARRFMGRGLLYDDLVQEGNLGLMRAIDKFDPERGFKFSTYAMWWIRQGISRAIVDQSRTVRLPVHLSETLAKIRRTEARLTARLERKPELSEIARELELSEERLQSFLQKVSYETSMQKPLADSSAEFGDFLADESAEQGLQTTEHNTLKQLLTSALDRLDSRSRYVVQAHHGLGGVRPQTLGDIGKVLGLSRERVRQIENEAFQRIRKNAREQHLEDFV